MREKIHHNGYKVSLLFLKTLKPHSTYIHLKMSIQLRCKTISDKIYIVDNHFNEKSMQGNLIRQCVDFMPHKIAFLQ